MLTKSMNMYIWAIGILNQLFIRDSYSQIKFSKRMKSLFFVISPFGTLHSFCLNNSFWQGSFVWKCCAFIPSALNQKAELQFFKKGFSFRKTCFWVKALKMFKISSDCHIKTCRSLKRRTILKIPSIVF